MDLNRFRADSKETPARRRGRWRLRRLPVRLEEGRSRRRARRTVIAALVAAAAVAAVAALTFRRAEPPEPGILRRVKDVSLRDTSGRVHTPADRRGSRASVYFFLGTECPVSNGYAPEMRRLAEAYGPRGIAFHGVHPDPDVSAEIAARHADEYRLGFPILLDPDQDLADQVGVTLTPEAAVLDRDGNVRYRGRIDDRHGPDGRRRPSALSRDLQAALDAVLTGRQPAVAETEAFGCPLPGVHAAVAGERVVYTKHVAPILAKRCVGCHRTGEVGVLSLENYRDAAKRATFLRDITDSGRMPPWKPRRGFGDFFDEAHLTRRELAVISAWADSGAPEGDPADLPPPPSYPRGWPLGEPDVVLRMPEPFVIPAGQDVYRAFVLPIPLDKDRGIAAVALRPGNRRVVHHARFYADATSDCQQRDRADVVPGFPTVGGGDIPKPTLDVWTPGSTPRLPQPGVGFVLRAGSDLVLLLHYHGTGKPEIDQSSVGLYYSRAPVTKSMYTVPLNTFKIDIPPGEPRHRIALRTKLPADVHAYSILPHGHFLLREIKVWANLPDGTARRLLWIDNWDFHWQGQYHFDEPIPLPRGTELHLVAHYDNSAGNPLNPNSPPARVRYGLTSSDEMLGCFIRILPDGPDGEREIQNEEWPQTL